MGLFRGQETAAGYEPSRFHRWFHGKVSGNVINGLGETERRRPRVVYHDQSRWHPWRIVQDGFYLRVGVRGFWRYVREAERTDRRNAAPIAHQRLEAPPEKLSALVKEKALELGADDVGVARVDPEWVFEGDQVREPWMVVLGTMMDYEALHESVRRNFMPSLRTVMETYNRGQRIAVELARWIRQQGWHAKGEGSPWRTPVAMIPAAIAAGLGELGKHGSLIHRRLGSNFRLAYVVTEMPLAVDAPTEFGADDFCLSCRLCTKECPPDAISDHKQMVRGVERWYVDFDRCVPYFNENFGCGICLAVCPWSRPGVGETLAAKMLRRRPEPRAI